MKLVTVFIFVATTSVTLMAWRLDAQTPLNVINFSFEQGNNAASSPITPSGADNEQFDGMMTETPNAPTNWTFAYEVNAPASANGLWGVQIPRANGTGNNNFYGSKPGFNGVTSLPSPFDGIQFAFINLNNTNDPPGPTVARADSGIVGTLRRGTYTLTVAVGARSTTAWPNIDYSIGLVTESGTELGTFTHQIMDPDSAAGNVPLVPGATDQVNIANVTYTLTVPEGDPLIGQNFFIRIRAANTGVGGTAAFTQANFDNVRLTTDAQVPVSIQRHPQGTNVLEGGTLVLSVTAFGTPALTYQWFSFDFPIDNQTNSTLVISNVTLAQEGTYTVAVSNAFSGAVSAEAVVTVTPTQVPTITQQPQSAVRYAGLNAQFQVQATGAIAFTYQWQRDETNIVNATNSTLLLSNVQPADAGAYRVIVTDSAGSTTSETATLTILIAAPGSYEAAVVSTGPAGYWRLGETNGAPLAIDYAGGSNGTNDTVTFEVEGALTNNTDTAAEFNANGAIRTGRSLLSGLRAFTLTGWIRPGASQFNRTGLFGQNDAIEFGLINPTNVQVFTPGGGNLTVPYRFPADEWHFVAAVGTGTNLSIYLDSARRGTGGTTPATTYGTSSFGFNIGGGGIFDTSTNFFAGRIDEVTVHTRALRPEEICDLFLIGSGAAFRMDLTTSTNGPAIIWPCGTLQSASALGPAVTWTDILAATSPYTMTNSAPMQFFRVRR